MKSGVYYLMLGAVLPFLLCSCAEKKQQSVKERSIRVTVGQLEKRLFREQLPVQGTVIPVDHAVISAKVSGTLEELKVSGGDFRKAGDVLFVIDRQILENQLVVKEDEINVKRAALTSAELALSSAEIAFAQARRDYERTRKLAESNAASLSNLETAETEFKKAEMAVESARSSIANVKAQLKQAESNLKIARKNLDDAIVKAPYDCVIFDTYAEENEYVTSGQDILKLESPGKLEVSCYISANYYYKVVSGQTAVEFKDMSGRVVGTGVVTYKSPGVDAESRTFELKAQVPVGVQLVSGMLADVNLILSEKESWGLPTEAMLLRANSRYIVFVSDAETRAQSVDVQRGVIDGSYCEVLNPDDLLGKDVVVSGQTFVNNNTLLDIIPSSSVK